MGEEDKLPMNVILFYAGTTFVLVILCSMCCFKCCNSHFCNENFPDPVTVSRTTNNNSSFRLSTVYPTYV